MHKLYRRIAIANWSAVVIGFGTLAVVTAGILMTGGK